MTTTKCARFRAIGPPILALAVILLVSPRAMAQSADETPENPGSVGVTQAAGVSAQFERAKRLFDQGLTARQEGRWLDARAQVDAAFDILVALRTSSPTSFGTSPEYVDLASRVLEVQAALTGDAEGGPSLTPPAPMDPADPEAGPGREPASTMAELGSRIEDAKPSEAARASNGAVLGTETIDLPIEMNDQVLGAIDLYSGRFNKWFSNALSRGLPYLPRIREILAAAGVPEDLAYVPIVESAFNPSALSRAKARGLWQFIPSTGKEYGLRQDFFVDERSNMEKATTAAAQYLKALYDQFGDWNLALAGYNAGQGTVLRAIRRSQTSDFWALAKTKSFRSETRNYVPLIHAAIVIAKSPESYGIAVSAPTLTAAETIRISGSYPIATVARCANSSPAEIRGLNPELRRGLTPSRAFDLDVPSGSGEQTAACLASERSMDYTRHVVRKRETLSHIAKMFGVSASEIARTNGLTLKSRLRPGTELAVPRPSRVAPTKTAGGKTRNTRPGDASYKIRKGDTLYSVALRHSTTVDAIKALNGLRSSRLSIGQVLRVASAPVDALP